MRRGRHEGNEARRHEGKSIFPSCLRAFVPRCLLLLPSCRRSDDMAQQPRVDPMEPSGVFADRTSARPMVEGTVPRGHLRTDQHFFFGKINGVEADTFPAMYPIERAPERLEADRLGQSNSEAWRPGEPFPTS